AKSLGDLTSDRDGDLIPDVYDAFPDDPHSAFAYQTPADGKLTIAFEDLYGRAGAGDADYNDFIAKYVVMEIADADNRIRQIELKADAAVKLAGYNHQFGIRLDQFKGSAHLTGTYIDQTGAIVPMDQTVSAPANILLFQSTRNAVGKSAGFVLEFDTPQVIDPENPTLNDVDRPPYNPYLYVLNTSQDIHLMGMQDLSGSFSKSFQDSEGFPWALLIPTDWRHPAETQRIEVHYPRFTLWRQSFGAQHGDWYLHYDDPYVPPVTTVVHVAGYYNAGSNDVAAYWKNDATGLQSLYMAADARALSAAVSGTDVYVAGYYTNDKGNLAAAYWKNGVPQPALYSDTTGSSSARANAIAVSGTDAYVAGWVSEGTRSACWWKNGVLQPLLYSADTSEGLGIAVSGEDVYIAGYYTNSAGNQAAALWKNGVPQPDLYSDTSGTGSARANAIVALSADVYAAGYYVPPAGAATACWWKNGVQQPDLSALAQATSVAVGGADVYVAGFLVNSAANLAAVWWKNGVQQPALYSDTGTYDARANAIVVHGTDVYVAGWVNEGTQGACYWKNGTRVDLYSGGSSLAGSIAVTD
ncbi:MAG: LruC domain-containing protein, partial [Chloroflexi bacterium]|nr:LruC domain-containing protein [Chloroflexota bacterium]